MIYKDNLSDIKNELKSISLTDEPSDFFKQFIEVANEKLNEYCRVNKFCFDDHITYGKNTIKMTYPLFQIIGITVRHNVGVNISNSHRCPDNGVVNFFGNDRHPRGYQGFTGRVTFVTNVTGISYAHYQILSAIGLKTGTGSSTGYYGGYEYSLFCDDFPETYKIIEYYENHNLERKLSGKSTKNNYDYAFCFDTENDDLNHLISTRYVKAFHTNKFKNNVDMEY